MINKRAMEYKLEETIKLGQEYMLNNWPIHTPRTTLFFTQLRYVSPLLWFSQFLVLIGALLIAILYQADINILREGLFFLAPLTAFLAVPEFFRDLHHDMSELEKVCKNSSATTLVYRLIAIGSVNLSVIILATGLLALFSGYSYLSLITYALVPFNLAIILNLLFIRTFKITSRLWALSSSLLAVTIIFYLSRTLAYFNILQQSIWMIMFFLSTTCLIWMLINTLKIIESFKEEVRWN